MIEKLGEVTLNYSFYKEGNCYNEGDEVEEKVLEVVISSLRRNFKNILVFVKIMIGKK